MQAGASMTNPISFTFANPDPSLKKHVMGLWLITCDLPLLSDYQRSDGIYLQFFLSGGGQMHFADGRTEQTFPVSLMSAASAAAKYEISGPFRLFGCRLTAHGWAALSSADASFYADRLSDAVTIFGEDILDVHKRLGDMAERGANIDAMCAVLQGYLSSKMRPVHRRHLEIIETTQAWSESEFSPRLDKLYAALPLGRRQAIRMVKRFFGVPPKILVRRLRASRTAALLMSANGSRDDLRALTGVYYDQAHMIHEIRHFTGHTPGGLEHLETGLFRSSLDKDIFMQMGIDLDDLAARSVNGKIVDEKA